MLAVPSAILTVSPSPNPCKASNSPPLSVAQPSEPPFQFHLPLAVADELAFAGGFARDMGRRVTDFVSHATCDENWVIFAIAAANTAVYLVWKCAPTPFMIRLVIFYPFAVVLCDTYAYFPLP